jgi:hypothetical protein
MTTFLVVVSVLGWLFAAIFFVLAVFFAIAIAAQSARIVELLQDLDVMKARANLSTYKEHGGPPQH